MWIRFHVEPNMGSRVEYVQQDHLRWSTQYSLDTIAVNTQPVTYDTDASLPYQSLYVFLSNLTLCHPMHYQDALLCCFKIYFDYFYHTSAGRDSLSDWGLQPTVPMY